MIDHIIMTVSNLPKSKEFYQKALAPLGYSASPEFTSASTGTKGVGFGVKEEGHDFHIIQGPPVVTPTHVAFRVNSREKVEGFHRAAITAGGRDNGSPGLTPEHGPDYYSAYVLDPDGHNIEAVCWEAT